jgi:hypothetical protein
VSEEGFEPSRASPTRPSIERDQFAVVCEGSPRRSEGVTAAGRTAVNGPELRWKASRVTKV